MPGLDLALIWRWLLPRPKAERICLARRTSALTILAERDGGHVDQRSGRAVPALASPYRALTSQARAILRGDHGQCLGVFDCHLPAKSWALARGQFFRGA